MSSNLLGLGLALQGVATGVEAGQAKAQASRDAEETRKASRAAALQRKQIGDMQLAEAGRTDALAQATQGDRTALLQEQLQTQQQEQKVLKNKLLRNESFSALTNFFDSGDPQSLNRFFKDNPDASPIFGGLMRVEKINLSNNEDRQLLRSSGVTDEELDAADGAKDGTIDWDKLGRRYVKGINTDGSVGIADIVAGAAKTGYASYADERSVAKMKALADISKASRNPNDTLTTTQKDAKGLGEARARIAAGQGTPEDQAMVEAMAPKPAGRDPNATLTSDQKNARGLADAQTRIAAGQGTPADHAFVSVMQHVIGGASAGRESLASTARDEARQLGLLNKSQEELQSDPKARKLVNQIELAHDISAAQQKELLELGSLAALSKEAGQISDDQTGVYDKLTNNVSSYTDDQIGGKTNRAAYGAFMNQFRHNLFGSALTPGEQASFKEAYSGLGQKAGPVLAGLRAALIQVKSKLTTLTNLNDPLVAKFRFGDTIDNAKSALAGIDSRIAYYDKVAAGMDPDKAYNETRGSKAPQTVEDVTAALFGAN